MPISIGRERSRIREKKTVDTVKLIQAQGYGGRCKMELEFYITLYQMGATIDIENGRVTAINPPRIEELENAINN